MAANPTNIYVILDKADATPKIVATTSKFIKPTNPQFNPPITTNIIAIISNVFSFIDSILPYYAFNRVIFLKNRPLIYYTTKNLSSTIG